MYSSGGMSNTINPFTSPSPSFFPLHYYQQDRTLEDYDTLYGLGHKLINSADAASAMKKKIRKDRHSKIVTAQGPRDRRVRLSIPVARKFFDLHDTLGLDKASETLDWLLTNSQPAIDDLLIKTKHCDEGSSRSHSIEEADDEIGDKHYMKSKSVILTSNAININTQEKARISSLLARVKRAEARARARERTTQKMSKRHHLFQTNKLVAHDFRIPANPWNELSYNKKSRAPNFNVGTDQVGQTTIYSETNLPTGARLLKPTTSSILDRIS